MYSFFAQIMYKLLLVFVSFTTLFGTVPGPATDDPIKSLDAENVKMTAVLWGDTQLSDYMIERHQYTKSACLDLANSEEVIDALVVAGDITENGKASEYRLLLDYLSVANDKVDNHIFAVGNHDVRLRAYCQLSSTFKEFCKAANEKLDITKLSYTYEVNGYTFIVLGTDKTVFEESHFTKETLTWFDNELAKASQNDKPIFVVVHQPLRNTHYLPKAWNSPIPNSGSIGKQSDDLKAIMNKYENVFFITGHLHLGFNKEWSIHPIDNFYGVNLPGVGPNNDNGYSESGIGYIMEVYDDEIVFRARNFAKGEYVPEYDVTVELD